MTRPLNKLSKAAVARAEKPGYYSDGGGLYLQVSDTGTKSFVFRYTINGRKREMGLGSAKETFALDGARVKARLAREDVAKGIDVIELIEKQRTHPKFYFYTTGAEAKQLQRLCRQIEAIPFPDYKDCTGAAYHKAWDDCRTKRGPIKDELNALASVIAQRSLGELPLTIRNERLADDYGPVVVTKIEIHVYGGGWTWAGSGLRLRKDGSVGRNHANTRLDSDRLWRRQLDGSWTPLIPPPVTKMKRAATC